MFIFCVLIVLIAGFSWGLTGQLRRYALARQLLDVPGQRSSHSQPTPRGGGLAIVVVFYLGLMVMLLVEGSSSLYWALLGGGSVVATLGFIDDHGHIPARWRLLGHFAAAVWVLYWLGVPELSVSGISPGMWLYPLLAVYLVWLLNLYNFMDGIDGIASVQAISTCFGAGLLYFFSFGALPDAGWLLLILAAAVAGFLCWNFPPARIFMGDVGSGFLGMVLGIFSLEAALHNPDWFWSWLILLGIFVTDASFTLLRRLGRGEKIHEAHRSHAYQRMARKLGSHRRVSLTVGVINLVWLVPLALVVGLGHLSPVSGLVLAYVPLLLLVMLSGAGEREVNP